MGPFLLTCYLEVLGLFRWSSFIRSFDGVKPSNFPFFHLKGMVAQFLQMLHVLPRISFLPIMVIVGSYLNSLFTNPNPFHL